MNATTTAKPATCCTTPEVMVIHSGHTFHCNCCGKQSPTNFVASVTIAQNQER